MKILKRLAIGAVVLVVASVLGSWVKFSVWSSEKIEALSHGSQIAQTELGPIEYSLNGESGPIVLFLHGTPGGYDQSPAASDDFRFLAPSRPGYLKTSLEVGATPTEQARSYLALLDALEISSVVVMGVSGGGPSAIAFAGLYPERTIGFVALEAVSKSESLDSMPWFLQFDFTVWLLLSLVQLQGDEALVSMLVPEAANQQRILRYPDKIQDFRRLVWGLWPPSRRAEGMKNDFEQFANLSLPIGEISSPTLIIHGTKDTNVDISHGELLAEEIPGATFYRIEGADHMLPLTHREEMQQVLAEFAGELNGN